MNIFKAHLTGFKEATFNPRMLFVIYVGNLALSLLVALPFAGILQRSAGSSLAINDLIRGFDFRIFQNISSVSQGAISTLWSEVKWVGIAYLLLNIFFVGGILDVVANKKFSVSSFFGGCGRNFFKLFFFNILMLVFHILLLVTFAVPLYKFFPQLVEKADSELTIYYAIGGIALLYSIFALYLLMVSDYGKNYMISKQSVNFLKAAFKGMGFCNRHFFKTYTLFFLLMIMPFAFFILYFFLDTKITMTSAKWIAVTFLVQQAFIYSRIWFRVWILASQYRMYVDDCAKDEARKIQRQKEQLLGKEQLKIQRINEIRQKELEKIQKVTKAKIEKNAQNQISEIEVTAAKQKKILEKQANEQKSTIKVQTDKKVEQIEQVVEKKIAQIEKTGDNKIAQIDQIAETKKETVQQKVEEKKIVIDDEFEIKRTEMEREYLEKQAEIANKRNDDLLDFG